MINVTRPTGRSGSPAGMEIRSAIQRIAVIAAVVIAPLPPLLAESFELPGSLPSVMVQQDMLGGTDPAADGMSVAPFNDSFSMATCTDGGCTSCGGTPPGFLEKICAAHDKSNACWIGRVDALILWRNAPPSRPLIETDAAAPFLNANQLDSLTAAGPRVSIIRRNRCSGDAIEATYFNVANFNTQRSLDDLPDSNYTLSDPGIYGNGVGQPFTSGTVNLGSRIQSFELNRLFCHSPNLRWIAGFRWIEWQENFWLQDVNTDTPTAINDRYATDCINSLYGGQIGADLTIFTLPWLRVDSVAKAGAYYNNAVQRSSYTTDQSGTSDTLTVRVGDSPLSCAFVGEVGMTGVMPITNRIDFRFGYFGLWLSGIAQPTQQLSSQQLVPGEDTKGAIKDNGGVLVQGVTLGLEGRW